MGKYIRKAKVSGEVAVVDVAHQSALGVRTRARALAAALQKPSAVQDPSFAYLELRSRRLEKPAAVAVGAKSSKDGLGVENSNPRGGATKGRGGPRTNSSGSVRAWANEDEDSPLDVEVSFGQNFVESEARERCVRETTPCSLIKDSETIGTPGSTTRPTNSIAAARRMSNPTRRNIPSAHEMENFFAGAEQLQQQIFMEKYNFDPVNDHPLPGRYEWVQLDF